MLRSSRFVPAVIAFAALSGCVERRIWIDSEPSGALVWVNHAQVGRTPVDVSFTHEGTYDVRIEKEGYEPLVTPATTEGPVWDMVPLDFVFEVLPIRARNETRWKFTLAPRDDSESALLERATGLRDRLRDEPVAVPAPEASPAPSLAEPSPAEPSPAEPSVAEP